MVKLFYYSVPFGNPGGGAARPRRTQMTAIAMTITATAATTGTIKLTFVKKYLTDVSKSFMPPSLLSEDPPLLLPSPGIPLAGAIVPIKLVQSNKI